jgi:hypothetical protein
MIFVTGERAILDALDFTLSHGSCISRLANIEDEDDLDIYAPLLTSINHAYSKAIQPSDACRDHGRQNGAEKPQRRGIL